MIAISYQLSADQPAETIHADDAAEAADTIAQMKSAGCIILGDYEVGGPEADEIHRAAHNRLL